MKYVMGIDTGGTYTDSVVMNLKTGCVITKSKVLTTHENLAEGIDDSIAALNFSQYFPYISRVVISTTLATNAIIEGKGQKTGLILTGRKLKDNTPAFCTCFVKGRINPKGREISPINRDEIKKAIAYFDRLGVKAIAVCGFMSIRNPTHEKEIEAIIKDISDLPVVCSYKISTDLGFFERTITTVLNASLLPIIKAFINAITFVLDKHNIGAPVYIVKCDGCMVIIDSILEVPVETILSGPVASVVGAIYLTRKDNAIVADMGGTTTDIVLVKNNNIPMSVKGAKIGGWQTMVRSIDISTIGLGGDSEIICFNNKYSVGPTRVLPACRNKNNPNIDKLHITPTDILHVTGEFRKWDYQSSLKAISTLASVKGLSVEEFVYRAIEVIINTIYNHCIVPYQGTGFTLIGIGAPAYTWFRKAADIYGFKFTVPKNYEIANAIGAAVAGIRETASAIIRPGENRYGFIVYFQSKKVFFQKKSEAIKYARIILRDEVENKAKKRGAISINISVDIKNIMGDWIDNKGKKEKKFIEMKIIAEATEIKKF